MKKCLYLYRINDPQTLKNLQFITIRLGVKVRRITDEMVGQKVGYITGLEGYTDEVSAEEYKVPAEQAMLMAGFTSQQVDQLLAFFRTAGLPKVNLKAMLTENNKDWYFYELHEELQREHEEFSKK